MSRTPSRRPRTVAVVVAATICAGGVFAGCAPTPGPTPSASTPASTGSGAATATPAPALVPDGSAADNLDLFAAVVRGVWSTERRAEGRAYIDALVAAGFPKADMEVTRDRTTVDNPADAIQFSVRWAGECLVGQVGPSTPEPTALVLPEVPGGTCLVGMTRPIDW